MARARFRCAAARDALHGRLWLQRRLRKGAIAADAALRGAADASGRVRAPRRDGELSGDRRPPGCLRRVRSSIPLRPQGRAGPPRRARDGGAARGGDDLRSRFRTDDPASHSAFDGWPGPQGVGRRSAPRAPFGRLHGHHRTSAGVAAVPRQAGVLLPARLRPLRGARSGHAGGFDGRRWRDGSGDVQCLRGYLDRSRPVRVSGAPLRYHALRRHAPERAAIRISARGRQPRHVRARHPGPLVSAGASRSGHACALRARGEARPRDAAGAATLPALVAPPPDRSHRDHGRTEEIRPSRRLRGRHSRLRGRPRSLSLANFS